MKKIFYPMLIALITVTACQPKTKTPSVDTPAEADAIRSLENQ